MSHFGAAGATVTSYTLGILRTHPTQGLQILKKKKITIAWCMFFLFLYDNTKFKEHIKTGFVYCYRGVIHMITLIIT